jgi:hypothetical protein
MLPTGGFNIGCLSATGGELIDRLDIVAIQIPQEHAVVASVVLRPKSWCMQQLRSGVQRRVVYRVDRVVRWRGQGKMHRSDTWVNQRTKPELRNAIGRAEADHEALGTLVPPELTNAKSGEDTRVESGGSHRVADLQSEMVDHRS